MLHTFFCTNLKIRFEATQACLLVGVQGPAEQWSSEFATQNGENDWANQFAGGFAEGIDTNWMEEYARDQDAQEAAAETGKDTDKLQQKQST